MKKKFLLVFFALPLFVLGQKNIDFNEGTIVQKNFCDTIPFEYIQHKIIVPIIINGKTKKFIVETGSTFMISDAIQSKMKNPKWGKAKVVDLNKVESEQLFVKVREIQLGHLTFQNTPALVLDISEMSGLKCFNYDGFIGSNLLRNCILHIDIANKILIITDNINNIRLQNAFQTDLKKKNAQGSPFIELNIGNKIKCDAQFDSSSDDLLFLNQDISDKAIKKSVSKILYPLPDSNLLDKKPLKDLSILERDWVENIQIGEGMISNIVIRVFAKNELYNHIGLELADYGTITIDNINNKFYFGAKEKKQEYKYQKTLGFYLEFERDKYSISNLEKSSQAEKNGIKNGFQVLKINNLDTSVRTPETDCKLAMTRPISRASKIKIVYEDDKGKRKTAELTEE